MEIASERSSDGAGGRNDENKTQSTAADEEGRHKQDTVVIKNEAAMADTERLTLEAGPSTSSNKKEEVDDQLKTTKAEMREVIEENQRLKMCLDKIMNEYRALEKQFQETVKQGTSDKERKGDDDNHKEAIEESDLVSLSLGRAPSNPKTDEKCSKVSKPLKDVEGFNEDLTLGLECKIETSKSGSTTEAIPNPSTADSCEVQREDAGETWPPSKVLKTMRDTEDEVAQQNPTKKARVCVRARCDTPTMNDGCQWRKYGQKIAKGNPCPRAYYRCTVAQSCPVRKQVQRCAEDMSILITTYEGTHNHNLPLSATAMASTTSAAASMLLSGSSNSHSASMPSSTSHLQGLNFYLSDNSSKPRQVYLSNPALSSSPSHPTITLDLTSNPPSSLSSSPFVRFSSNQPRYPSSTSLSFSSSESNALSWSNGLFLNYNNYSSNTQPYNNNRNNILSSLNFGRQQIEDIYQSYMQKNHTNNINNSSVPLPDTISAATKAITADPTFQSALAAALTSIIGSNNNNQLGVAENSGQNNKMKWGEVLPASNNKSTASNKVNGGCAFSFANSQTKS